MKTLLFSLLIAFAFFFASVDNAKAQCPTGYTPTTRIIPVGGCDFEVSICYKCDVTGLTPNWVYAWDRKQVDPTCTPTLSEIQITAFIKNLMTSGSYLNSLCGSEDCETGNKKKYNFIVPSCLKKVRTEYPVGSGLYPRRILNCDTDSYCVEEYEVCTDYTLPEPRIESRYINSTQYGSFDCDGVSEPNFPPSGQETNCYEVPSKCNE